MMDSPISRLLIAAIWLLAFLLLSGCDPSAKFLGAGPFSGQIVDAQSGRPVPGAFVAFTWGGSSWIEGHSRHLLDVLVQTDAEGRYNVPWQGDKLDTTGWHSISWGEEIWAPGYVLLQTGKEELSKQTSSIASGLQIRLTRTTSTMEALTMRNRMAPSSYRNPNDKNGKSSADVSKRLALALYRDSYHRVCEDELSDGARGKQYVETPRADVSTYRHFAASPPYSAKQVADQNDAWAALDRKAGWTDSSGPVRDPPRLDISLLPELCRLSRFGPAFSENPE
jgi:hypothetical protein